MMMIARLLAEEMSRVEPGLPHSGRSFEVSRSHECDGCGEVKPDVDLWAEDGETGEELWLCEACGDW